MAEPTVGAAYLLSGISLVAYRYDWWDRHKSKRVIHREGLVLRTLLGLLAAVGSVASALVGLIHGSLLALTVCVAAIAAGLLAYAAAPSKKTC